MNSAGFFLIKKIQPQLDRAWIAMKDLAKPSIRKFHAMAV
jgi:hypothetical protein